MNVYKSFTKTYYLSILQSRVLLSELHIFFKGNVSFYFLCGWFVVVSLTMKTSTCIKMFNTGLNAVIILSFYRF